MWVRLLLPASLLLIACTEVPSDPSTCESEAFRLTEVRLPRTGGEASSLGFDLDGDGTVDNDLGTLSAAIGSIYGEWDPESWLRTRLAEGEVHWVARIDRCGDGTWSGQLASAEDADGDGSLEILDEGEAARGTGAVASGGIGLVPVGYFADGGGFAVSPAWEAAGSLHLSARSSGSGAAGLSLTLGLAVVLGDEALAPAAAFLTHELAGGSLFAGAVDTNDDGVVSVTELRAHPTVSTLLDFDIDTDGDGAPDAISIGFTATAESVAPAH